MLGAAAKRRRHRSTSAPLRRPPASAPAAPPAITEVRAPSQQIYKHIMIRSHFIRSPVTCCCNSVGCCMGASVLPVLCNGRRFTARRSEALVTHSILGSQHLSCYQIDLQSEGLNVS